MAKFGVTTLSAIKKANRWDSTFHIALSQHRDRVDAFLHGKTRDEINEIIEEVGYSKDAWNVVQRGGRRHPPLKGAFPDLKNYSDEEAALYAVLVSYDDAITDEIRAALDLADKKTKQAKARNRVIKSIEK